jgi:hypothetical protein
LRFVAKAVGPMMSLTDVAAIAARPEGEPRDVE